MAEIVKGSWTSRVEAELDDFCCRLEAVVREERQLEVACRKASEMELRLQQELKLNEELLERLAELERRDNELDRVCGAFESRLTIADSDKNRLDLAKDSYQLAKELTGIRLDFSAPPNVVKGYIKSERRKQLRSFELQTPDSEALWSLLQAVVVGDENTPPN
ncbi:hypothetical protein ACJJTC_002594 [Scirpophaga incertulas]